MSQPQSVLQVNTSDVGGGAERVMLNLHERYLALGVDSWIAVGVKHSESDRVLEIPNEPGRSGWARSLEATAASLEHDHGTAGRMLSRPLLLLAEPARYRRILAGAEDFDYPGTSELLNLPPTPPDVLHLHNLHGYYFDVRLLPGLSATQPTVLTLHDTWLLTGHCAHPFDCPRWKTGCGDCPDLGMYVPISRDASAANWQTKHEAVRDSTVAVAAPSRWLMRMAEQSGLITADTPTRVIPNGVDVDVFSPGDALAAREQLGLPPDRAVVLFAARNVTSNPFKDFTTLVGALRRIAETLDTSPVFVALGADTDENLPSQIDILRAPFETDPNRLALWYRAADVYAHPARAESFGMAAAEAMACGTAVVASNVGGLPEIVIDGKSGLLVEPGDAGQLASAIISLLEDPARREAMRRGGLQRVAEQFTVKRQAEEYLTFYAESADVRRARASVGETTSV